MSEYKIGEVVRYLEYHNELIYNPNRQPPPSEYLKIESIDTHLGIINTSDDTVKIDEISKINFIEYIEWWLFWK